MKAPLLALVAMLLSLSTALANEWTTLSGIGDRIELKKDQVALLVSTSRPSYVIVDKPGRESLALDVKPYRPDARYFIEVGQRDRDEVMISWRRPFAIAGPCVIELRSPAALTLRRLGGESR